jgi:NAD(P)-dependent dehydrogenase (short-subunit alcohol dehydrogenase family)
MTMKGQRVVILGGSSGIGLATAQAVAAQGASVAIASSNKVRVDEALATLPPGAEGYAVDLTEEAMLGSDPSIIWSSPPARRCNSALSQIPTSPPRAAFSICATGEHMGPPSTPPAAFVRAVRSSSRPA